MKNSSARRTRTVDLTYQYVNGIGGSEVVEEVFDYLFSKFADLYIKPTLSGVVT